MKVNNWPGLLALLALGAASLQVSAQDAATVKADRVNVRGQANVGSEVVTQLRKGEPVIVLDEISVEKPKPGDPAKWLKIVMPTNTPVWVNATFLTNHVVMPKVLNVRSGPGEQFSVIGRLDRDATVQEIRVVENWMEIIAPTNTFAFVAADLIDRPNAPVAKTDAAPAKPAEPAPTPVVVPAPAPAPAPVTETVKVEPTPAPAPVVDNAPKTVVVAEAKPAPAPEPVAPAPAPAPLVIPVPAPAAPKAPPADVVIQPIPSDVPGPKRLVTREGVVRRSISIQAPSAFLLANPETGDTLDYLYAGDTGLQIKYYLGKRIRVSGEEVVDARWVGTPVVTIQTLEPLP